MYLCELITALENENPERVISRGFNSPHSYRGYYDQLAFEPANNVTVAEMLECAREALGNTYTGYKGGDYTMHEYTEVNIAYYGHCGEPLSKLLLHYLLSDDNPWYGNDQVIQPVGALRHYNGKKYLG